MQWVAQFLILMGIIVSSTVRADGIAGQCSVKIAESLAIFSMDTDARLAPLFKALHHAKDFHFQAVVGKTLSHDPSRLIFANRQLTPICLKGDGGNAILTAQVFHLELPLDSKSPSRLFDLRLELPQGQKLGRYNIFVTYMRHPGRHNIHWRIRTDITLPLLTEQGRVRADLFDDATIHLKVEEIDLAEKLAGALLGEGIAAKVVNDK